MILIRATVIVCVLLLSASWVGAGPLMNTTVKYYIDIDSHRKGILEFRIDDETVRSDYFGVDAEDRLPFYATSKKFRTGDGLTLDALEKNGESFSVYYEIDKAPERARSYVAGDSGSKAIIWDEKQQRPSLTFERIPAVVMESILIGFFNNRIKEQERYLFYDGEGHSAIRLYFEKAPQGDLELAGSSCAQKAFVCKRTNVPGQPDMEICRVFLNRYGIPFKVLSNSGRWSLELGAVVAEPKTITFDYLQDLGRSGSREFEKLAHKADRNLTVDSFVISSQNSNEIVYSFGVSTPSQVEDDDRTIALSLLANQYKTFRKDVFDQSAYNTLGSNSDYYFLEVGNGDACKLLRKSIHSGDLDDDCRFVRYEKARRIVGDELNRIMELQFRCEPGSIRGEQSLGSDEYYCKVDGKEEEIDLKRLAAAFLKSRTDDEIEVKKAELTVKENGGSFLAVEYELKQMIGEETIVDAASQVISQKLGGNVVLNAIKRDIRSHNGKYVLPVSKQNVAERRKAMERDKCSGIAGKLGASTHSVSDTEKTCRLKGQFIQPVSRAIAMMEQGIYDDYPDLVVKGQSIRKDAKQWSITYVSGYEGVQNDCR